MTNQPLNPNEREPVSESAEVEPTEAEIWAELNAGKPASEASDNDAMPQDGPADDADDGESRPTGEDGKSANPPEVRPDFDAVKAERDRLDHLHRTEKGRVAALQRRLATLEKQMKSAPVLPDRAGEIDPLKGLADDYPEIEKPLRASLSQIDKRFEELSKAEEARLNDTKEEFEVAQREYADHVADQTEAVNKTLPDWQPLVSQNQNAFRQWVEDQPRAIREAAYRNADHIVDAAEAIQVIGAFRQHITGQQQPSQAGKPNTQPNPLNGRREQQLDGMSSPQGTKRNATISGIPQDGDEEAIWQAVQADKRRQTRA